MVCDIFWIGKRILYAAQFNIDLISLLIKAALLIKAVSDSTQRPLSRADDASDRLLGLLVNGFNPRPLSRADDIESLPLHIAPSVSIRVR
ncbi:MAG TPA: hypothetical protein VM260_27790, partial [Pirellula sp.]|nr:hypothetical protein [Pirellula sp.]